MTTEATFAIPDHWSAAAREAFEETLSAREDLDGADLAALEQACELISQADALRDVAAAAGWISRSDAGHEIPHRAASEARQARASASAILARLSDDPGGGAAAARAMNRARYRK